LIEVFPSKHFTKMPWKNGKGTTTQIHIFPSEAKLEKNDFLYRFSSAPIQEDGEFSSFPNKMRLLIPIKGAGFQLNSQIYDKFEIAHFSGNEKTFCKLLKDSVLDFGVIYDAEKIKVSPKIVHLKSSISFTLESDAEYFVTVLSGTLFHQEHPLSELETLHFKNENFCALKVEKSVVIFFLKMEFL